MTTTQRPIPRAPKNPRLILCPIVVWAILVFLVIWPWAHQINELDLTFSILAHASAFIWWAVLLWALHHLTFQLGALFMKKHKKGKVNSKKPEIVVLYATCDDFSDDCCRSCLDQDYKNFSVLICDDSVNKEIIGRVDNFQRRYSKDKHKPKCEIIRRMNKSGFKAGNLNYAIREKITKADWVLLVDADQVLPHTYISDFVTRLPQESDHNIAFVQAAHCAIAMQEESSLFQEYLSPEVSLYYSRDLSLRNSFGFIPLLGHGAMISKLAWEKTGGFPEVVSEDFAFALRVANKELQGWYIEDVLSEESYPYDFGGFIIRLKKFAGGTAELGRREVIPFFIGPARTVEKWDFVMMLFWYVLMPFVTINGFLGAYVCHVLWSTHLPYLHPLLPYLYSWMIICIFVIHISVAKNVRAALLFYFWSTAIYTAAMPVAGWSFMKHLFRQPSFERTPKNKEEKKTSLSESWFVSILGLIAIICSVIWWSPFSPLLLGQGIAYSSYRIYGYLCSHSRLGAAARILVYLPGIFMIVALYTMWSLGRY
jgi:cellulose synthase/poly-beta-1,6-N-acetylglucosamine synthase-like glycosyltransferase